MHAHPQRPRPPYAFLQRAIASQSGQTLVIVALGMLLLVAFLGLAVDAAQLRHAQRQLQTQADAAALAAALELTACNHARACSAMQAAASQSLAENDAPAATLHLACDTANPFGNTVLATLNNPPCALGAADPNSGNAAAVELVLTRAQPTHFVALFGFASVLLHARAEAGNSAAKGAAQPGTLSAVLVQ